jgi:Uma2 family endonuclease
MNEQTSFGALREEPMRFTAEEFLELSAGPPLVDMLGKFELVDGVVVHVSPAYHPHSRFQSEVYFQLRMAFGQENPKGWTPLVELTVRLNGFTVREPDIAVVRDPVGKTGPGTPDEVLMLVEIAYSTLTTDLNHKRLNYAKAGVPHYWVVDVEGRKVHVMTTPKDGDYQHTQVLAFGTDIPVPETDRSINLT